MLSSTCAHSSRLKDSDLNYHIEAALPACKKKNKKMHDTLAAANLC